ncbi:cell division protein [Helicobacter pylori 26695]|nr:cell division protein [Helicobacter pylori 26695]
MDNRNIDPYFNPEQFLETQKYKGTVTALIFLLSFFYFFNGGF